MGIGSSGGSGGAKDVRAGGAYVDIYAKDGVRGVLAKVKQDVLSLAGTLRRTGMWTAGAGAAIGGGPLAYLMGGVNRGAQVAQMAEFSQQFKVPIAVMNKLKYAADMAGVSIGEVMNDNTGKFRALIAKAPDMDEGDAKKALQIQQDFKAATQSLENAMLPVVEILAPLVKEFAAFVKENARAVTIIAGVGAALVAVGTSMSLVSIATTAAISGAGLLKTAWLGLARYALVPLIGAVKLLIGTLVALVSGGITAVVGGFTLVTSITGLVLLAVVGLAVYLRKDLVAAFRDIAQTFTQTWSGIMDAVQAGDLALAFEVAGAGLRVAWQRTMLFLSEKWSDFREFFVEGWHSAVTWVAKKLAWLLDTANDAIDSVMDSVGAGGGGKRPSLEGMIDDDNKRERAERERARRAALEPRRAALEAAQRELDAITRRAAGAAAGVRGGDAVADYFANRLALSNRPFTGVKSGFNLASAQQQFGYGNQATQSELMRQIAVHTAAMEKGIFGLIDALRTN